MFEREFELFEEIKRLKYGNNVVAFFPKRGRDPQLVAKAYYAEIQTCEIIIGRPYVRFKKTSCTTEWPKVMADTYGYFVENIIDIVRVPPRYAN